jgi:hypothetical protein
VGGKERNLKLCHSWVSPKADRETGFRIQVPEICLGSDPRNPSENGEPGKGEEPRKVLMNQTPGYWGLSFWDPGETLEYSSEASHPKKQGGWGTPSASPSLVELLLSHPP